MYSFQQFTQTSIFILINPFNNVQDCNLKIHVSQAQQMSHENHQVADKVAEEDHETEEEKEVDDSTYETEVEPTTETESEDDDNSDNNQPRR